MRPVLQDAPGLIRLSESLRSPQPPAVEARLHPKEGVSTADSTVNELSGFLRFFRPAYFPLAADILPRYFPSKTFKYLACPLSLCIVTEGTLLTSSPSSGVSMRVFIQPKLPITLNALADRLESAPPNLSRRSNSPPTPQSRQTGFQEATTTL